MQNNVKYWVWLSRLVSSVKLSTLHYLLDVYKSPEKIWKATKDSLTKKGIYKTEIEEIQKFKYRQNIENYLYYMNTNKINIISCQDEEYPDSLRNIKDYPVVLYVKGNTNILKDNAIGIVGCRLCSSYGRDIAQEFAYNLTRENLIIVSGLARGIDTWAHIGTIKANGKTIAVLGSGLDIIYPPENKVIYQKIIEKGGAIISEYIVGTRPIASNFPRRNRLISGLSKGVLLVEAKKRSGSFITIDFALEQGKDVYAIPGDIHNVNSVGTNELIKQGAKLVTNVDDILEDIL